MRFDLQVRQAVRERLAEVSSQMAAWDKVDAAPPENYGRLVEAIEPFEHTTVASDLYVGGAEASGDYPAVAYGDAFVYTTLAFSALYRSDTVHGLREVECGLKPLVEFTWLSANARQRTTALLESFERLAGRTIDEVLEGSDYRDLVPGTRHDTGSLKTGLIIPMPHDAGNLGIQLRATAELGSVLRLIESLPAGALVLSRGTMSLPFVRRGRQSLYFEHLRRFCCVRAREREVTFVALSSFHGLPAGIRIEEAAREKLGESDPEHWFFRVPDLDRDGWSPWPSDGPRVPPAGAVTLIVRLHRSGPIMRVDLDRNYWERYVGEGSETAAARRLLVAIDYASHDQRCYGYPYPIQAARTRGSLTAQERTLLRHQFIEASVGAGMRRSAFRDVSQDSDRR